MFNFSNYNLRNLKVSVKNVFVKTYYKNKRFLRMFLSNRFCFDESVFSKRKLFYYGGGLILVLSFSFCFICPPSDFPVGSIIKIESGKTLTQIAENLENENVIKSAPIFSFLTKILMNEKGVMAGDYFFEEKYSICRVVWRTIRGVFGISPIKITFIEGSTIFDVAGTLKNKFPDFDTEEFLKLAKAEEGFLFPDTYYFLSNVTPAAVIKTMRDNFDIKIKDIAEKIEKFGKTLEEIVIMASILEKEARTLNSKRIISGILWKRIDINMPLQVDAVFPYINGKNTYQLSLADLKIDSPYNTYTNKGLPIGPIANPSMWSLLAAVTPVDSNYLFYLSDRSGNMYYAADFEQHKQNKRLYMY
ncbi:MAG: endolytic transglycosylase MltG [Patescibacteria group bacterium]